MLVAGGVLLAGLPGLPTAEATPNVTGRRLSGTAGAFAPAISGHRVAYAVPNGRTGGDPNEPEQLFDVTVRNLRTGRVRVLSRTGIQAADIDIAGSRVIWRDAGHPGAAAGIYLFNLQSGSTRRLAKVGGEPRLDGHRVVSVTGGHVFVLNLEKGTDRRLSALSATAAAPDVSGSKVVWQQGWFPNLDIWSYDLVANRRRQLTTNKQSQTLPRISGDRVVWADNRNGSTNADVYLRNLRTGALRRITARSGNQVTPVISGTRIVYLDSANGVLQIYDLRTGADLGLSTPSVSAAHPEIANTRTVYEGSSPNGLHVYLAVVS
jgi:beta propeller repeat protein